MTEPKSQTLGLDDPLNEDEVLIHRFLDGDLSLEESVAFDARLERDPEFQTRLNQTRSLFELLESSALARSALLWSPESKKILPPTGGLVETAITRWKTDHRPDGASEEE